jgi:multidrug transporter EmrE-like cation transporter
MIGWLALICAILFNTAGNFFIKHFSLTSEVQSPLSYLNPWFILDIAFFGVNVFLYSRALKDIPLVVAYPHPNWDQHTPRRDFCGLLPQGAVRYGAC